MKATDTLGCRAIPFPSTKANGVTLWKQKFIFIITVLVSKYTGKSDKKLTFKKSYFNKPIFLSKFSFQCPKLRSTKPYAKSYVQSGLCNQATH